MKHTIKWYVYFVAKNVYYLTRGTNLTINEIDSIVTKVGHYLWKYWIEDLPYEVDKELYIDTLHRVLKEYLLEMDYDDDQQITADEFKEGMLPELIELFTKTVGKLINASPSKDKINILPSMSEEMREENGLKDWDGDYKVLALAMLRNGDNLTRHLSIEKG